MSGNPLVSVLMTAYNREKYIAQAIESVLASSFENFELIIVDDNSTDDTVAIVRRYIGDARVQVHINEKNLGDYHNRNRAAALARGKYLKYLDSDDYIYAHGLEVMVAGMEKFPTAALGMERLADRTKPYPLEVSPNQAYKEHFLHGGLFLGGPTESIIRTAAFHELGGFTGKRFVGDTEMWLNLCARYSMVKLPQGLTWRLFHDGMEFALGHSSFGYAEMSYKMGLDALTNSATPFDAEERKKVIHRYKQGQGRILLHLAIIQRQPRIALKTMQKMGFSWRDMTLAFSAKPKF